jgi:hypothetical protein
MDMMAIRRRVLMGQISIPSGYRRIEYAESDGSAFVQLPFGFDRTDEIETRFTVLKKNNETYLTDKYIVSPSIWNNNSNRFAMGIHTAGNTYYNDYCIGFGKRATNTTFLQPTTLSDFLMHTWEYKDGVFNISEIGLTLDVNGISFGGTTYPLKLFYGYNSNTMGKIAYYKHKHDGVLYNIIPIQKISDGTVEMYDMVSKNIMPRTGTLLAPT